MGTHSLLSLLLIGTSVTAALAATDAPTKTNSPPKTNNSPPNSAGSTKVDTAPMPQKSPIFPNLVVDPNAPTTFNTQSNASASSSSSSSKTTFTGYPEPWKTADTQSPEVKAAIAAIDFSLVPQAPVRHANKDGGVSADGYDTASDPYCWWTQTGCMHPKAPNLPPDMFTCPEPKTWGLTYDDGPLVQADPITYAEPYLYNVLAKTKQTAQLFYIGSNVIQAPQAAQRALADGHVLCVHTWSHQAMTSLTNEQIVAELYWTLKAIKQATGVTTKCWRPPYGDADDRVRAIAYQMGLTNWLWDQDTNDWNIKGPGGGSLSPDVVDGYFQGWIQGIQNGSTASHGTVTLQHELNAATVQMAEKWLPKVQATYTGGVMPGTACQNISQPYWESQWVYKTVAQPNPTPANASLVSATTANTSTSSSSGQQSVTSPSNTTKASSAANTLLDVPITLVSATVFGVATFISAIL